MAGLERRQPTWEEKKESKGRKEDSEDEGSGKTMDKRQRQRGQGLGNAETSLSTWSFGAVTPHCRNC